MAPIPRDDNEPIEKKVWRLELLQDEQERKNAAMYVDMACIKETAEEAKELAMQTNASIESMPLKVIDAIKKENSGKRMEAKEWTLVIFGLIGAIDILQSIIARWIA